MIVRSAHRVVWHGRLVLFVVVLAIVPSALECSADRVDPTALPAYPNHRDLSFYINQSGERQSVRTTTDWRMRRQHILLGMQAAMGKLPSRNKLPALAIAVTQRMRGDGYERQALSFVTEVDKTGKPHRLTAYLYLPTDLKRGAKRPAILALHPTHRIGKGVVDGQSERPNRAYAKELAQRGYVVIAPDYPSFGEQAGYNFTNDAYVSGTMKGIVNHMRCVDLLVDRREVDTGRIGVIGHSLGGHNAMFVGAFDERLKVVVSSCGWTPFHDYYGGKIKGWTSDRYMPRLRNIYKLDPDRVPFDFYEVVAALAPRAFFSNSPKRDGNFDYRGVKKAEAEAAKVFALHKQRERLQVRYPDAGHDFPPAVRLEAYRFIDRALDFKPKREVIKAKN